MATPCNCTTPCNRKAPAATISSGRSGEPSVSRPRSVRSPGSASGRALAGNDGDRRAAVAAAVDLSHRRLAAIAPSTSRTVRRRRGSAARPAGRTVSVAAGGAASAGCSAIEALCSASAPLVATTQTAVACTHHRSAKRERGAAGRRRASRRCQDRRSSSLRRRAYAGRLRPGVSRQRRVEVALAKLCVASGGACSRCRCASA